MESAACSPRPSVDAEKRRFSFSSMVLAPVLKIAERPGPAGEMLHARRGNHHPGERLRLSNYKNFNDPTQLRIRVFCPGIFAFLAVFWVRISRLSVVDRG